jgi:molybdenum cofactor cytidylyltransferase
MVPALILSAGRSSRMGRTKALLPCPPSGVSFVRHLATALLAGGAADVIVVGRPGHAELEHEVAEVTGRIRYVENPTADDGQLSSLLAGLNAADRPGVRGVLVAPVDIPLVLASTVGSLLSVFASSHAPIVRATHGGVHGHPVVFSRAVFDELRRADPSRGAKVVVRAHEDAIINVEVDDPGVLRDVDTPEDYQALFGAPPPPARR